MEFLQAYNSPMSITEDDPMSPLSGCADENSNNVNVPVEFDQSSARKLPLRLRLKLSEKYESSDESESRTIYTKPVFRYV